MVTLKPEQVGRVAALFAEAFADDPLYVEFFPDPALRRHQLSELCRFQLVEQAALVQCSSEQLEGCALWIPPDARQSPYLRLATVGAAFRLVARVPWPTLYRLWKYHRFATRLRAELVPGPHWYLEVVGVAPDKQGHGFASGLIRPILERATREQRPCYLETQNAANVPLYQRYGFEVAAQMTVPGTGLTHFAMVRTL